MLKRYYPISENLLSGIVAKEDLFDYIWHGFILVKMDDGEKYASCCLTKPIIWIARTPQIDMILEQKVPNSNNLSSFIKLITKLKHIQIHHKEPVQKYIDEEIRKEEFKQTIEDFKETLNYLINRMFPEVSNPYIK